MAGWLWWLPGELLAEPHHCCSDAYQLLQALFCHKYHVLLIMSMMLFKTSSIVHKISSKMFSSSWSLSNLQYFLYYFLNHYFTFVKTVIPNAQQFTKLMQYFFSRTKACKFWTFFSYNAYLNVSILILSLKACILFAFHTSLNLYVM